MAFAIVREDLARVRADAIVVPANPALRIDGGTVLAVAKAAGRWRLQRACNRLGGCPMGKAVATAGYRLPADHIIHAVGPVWRGGGHGEAGMLRSAYDSALDLALRLNARSVALPLLSTGAFGYPVRPAFDIAVQAIRAFLGRAELDVILVVYDRRAVQEGSRLFGEIAEYISDAEVDSAIAAGRESQNIIPRAWGERGPACDAMPLSGYPPGVSPDGMPRVHHCDSCGFAPSPGSRFCPRCGRELARNQRADPDLHMRAAPSAPADAPAAAAASMAAAPPHSAPSRAATPDRGPATPDLGDLLANMDDTFSVMLLQLIDARGLTDAQVYKRANITRQHFSKIRRPDYRPTKKTVLALAIALELPLPETRELLARAGFALSRSSTFDIIVEYFITRGDYDIFDINEALFSYDQPLLG